jgi:hypothetical protein
MCWPRWLNVVVWLRGPADLGFVASGYRRYTAGC